MSLPALARTHQFKVNASIAGQGTALAQNQNLMFALSQALVGAGTFTDKDGVALGGAPAGAPTIRISSDGTTAGSGNKWVTASNLIWNTAGNAHSWAVIALPGIGANAELLIDLVSASTGTATITFSPTGFDAAHGGANGTSTTAPTALNGQIKVNNTSWGGTTTINTSTVLSVSFSTDGKDVEINMFRAGFVAAQAWFCVPSNTLAGWTTPSDLYWEGSAVAAPVADVRTFANTCSDANTTITGVTNTSGTATLVPMTLSAANGAGKSLPEVFTAIGDVSAGYNFVTAHLTCVNGGFKDGALGLRADRWFADTAKATGFGYPGDEVSAGLRNQVVKVGPWLRPWNKTTPVTS